MPYLKMHKCLFNESGEWTDQIGDGCLNDIENESDSKEVLIEFLSREIHSSEWYELFDMHHLYRVLYK